MQPADSASPPASTNAFSYPNYRRYWLASVAMVFGVQFRFIGSGWLVYELTDSPFWLGIPGVLTAIMTVALTVPAGDLADRIDNQRLLVWGRGLTGLSHFMIAALTVAGVIQVWMVLVWAALAGALAAMTNPAQAAMLPRLIERQAMASAVALTASVWNATRIVAPAAAGLVIATLGTGEAFFVAAAGYGVSTLLVALLKLAPIDRTGHGEHGGMLAGVRYIAQQRVFLAIVGLSFFTSMFGASYVVLLPIFADEILGTGVTGFGYMEAAAGAGALLGTLAIVYIPTGRHAGTVMVGAAMLFGLWIAAFAASRSLGLSLALLFAGSFFSSIYLNLGMTMLQLLVPDELRGRVMGVWGLTWFLSSAGGFVAASAAAWIGAPLAVALGALSVAGFGLVVYARFPEVRNIPGLGRATSP